MRLFRRDPGAKQMARQVADLTHDCAKAIAEIDHLRRRNTQLLQANLDLMADCTNATCALAQQRDRNKQLAALNLGYLRENEALRGWLDGVAGVAERLLGIQPPPVEPAPVPQPALPVMPAAVTSAAEGLLAEVHKQCGHPNQVHDVNGCRACNCGFWPYAAKSKEVASR